MLSRARSSVLDLEALDIENDALDTKDKVLEVFDFVLEDPKDGQF